MLLPVEHYTPFCYRSANGVNNHDAIFVHMPGTHFTTAPMDSPCLPVSKVGFEPAIQEIIDLILYQFSYLGVTYNS